MFDDEKCNMLPGLEIIFSLRKFISLIIFCDFLNSGFLDNSPTYSDSGDLSPSNPFLENERKDSPLDLALQLLQNLTARRAPSKSMTKCPLRNK